MINKKLKFPIIIIIFIILLTGCFVGCNSKDNKIEFSVQLNIDGEEFQNIIVDNNKKICDIVFPTKEGYDLDGWYQDNNMTQRVDRYVPIKSNLIIYGKWVKNTSKLRFSLNEDNESYEVWGSKDKDASEIIIPNMYNNLLVTKISNYAFVDLENLNLITIPESVTYIGKSAFKNCNNLKSLVIPNSVAYIGDSAFENCDNLKSLVIPNSVTYVGEKILKDCWSIEYLTVPFLGTERNLSDTSKTLLGCYFADDLNGVCQFYEKEGYGLKTKCFFIPSSLKSVRITDSVNISYGAFSNCKSIENITISNGVKKISDYAFYNCENLKKFEIPNKVETIGKGAFDGCDNISKITFEKGSKITEIGESAFLCKSLKKIILPNTVNKVGESAFYDHAGIATNVFCVSQFFPEGMSWGDFWHWNHYYLYSENKPTKRGIYWHYFNGNITKWKNA